MRGRGEQVLSRPTTQHDADSAAVPETAGSGGSAQVPRQRTAARWWRRTWSLLRRGPDRRPILLGELVIVVVLLRVYDLIRGQAEVRRGSAVQHGEQLMRLEGNLRIKIEPAVNRWVAGHHDLSVAASYWYQYAHLTVTLSMLAWCWWKRPESYRSARNSLVLINAAGLLVFFLYPVAPPRLLPGYGFIDAVAEAGFGTSHGGPVTADQYGALPSLHIGWAVWTALVGYRLVKSRSLSLTWLCYPLITCLVIVGTGNHYLLDAVAGAVLAIAAQHLTHLVRRSPVCGSRSGLRRLHAPKSSGAKSSGAKSSGAKSSGAKSPGSATGALATSGQGLENVGSHKTAAGPAGLDEPLGTQRPGEQPAR
jgi:hypothetical protein